METAPIILLAYNRPEHVERAVASLLRNAEAAQSDLYIYCDGAKPGTDPAPVERVREIARSVEGFREVHLVMRERNYGLAANVIDSVTQVVNAYGRVIVVEDDLVVAPYFLRFMNDALETYKDEERVGHIQACDFTHAPLPDTFLIKWTGSWGWATWKRAWRHFNPDGKALLDELRARGLTRRFDFNGKYGFTRMLRRQTQGINDSWAIRWNATLFLADILSLNVGRSLVANEGFDGSGTNCGGGGLYDSLLYPHRLAVEKIEPIEGVRPFLLETQALVSSAAYGTPQRSATGFDQRRLNMLLAVLEKRVGFKLMQKDVFLNIAGGLRVTDMAMDLSVIAAVLSSNVDTPIEAGWCMCGEVGLSGEVRAVNRIEQRIAEAEKLGFTDIVIPALNLKSVNPHKYNIKLHPVRKVEEALRVLFG